jgi:ParB family chromosome partitioning protein
MTCEYIDVPLHKLEEQPDNPNKMDDEHFKMLVESIRVNGFLQPILISFTDKRWVIVDGHHRARAAREIGMETVPALIKDFDKAQGAKAVQIGMNKLRGDLDLAKVAAILSELTDAGMPTDYLTYTTGFTPDEIEDLLSSLRGTSEEDVLASASIGEEEVKAATMHVLEIEFTSFDEMRTVKRKLKRAAKDTQVSLGDALYTLLEGEEDDSDAS